MARNQTSHNEETGYINEQTSLLAASDDLGNGTVDQTLLDDDTDIDSNEFDILLSKSESITGGLGIEPESQETAMLRGPRKYSTVKSTSRHSSRIHRHSFLSSTSDRDAISEDPAEEEDEPKSPYRGVSVSRFWLVFGGVLANNFVACFDGTIMVSSHPVITSYFNSANSASWLSTAFLLTSTSFQPLFGRLSDTIGRKTPYIFTLTVFLVSTIWCGLAQSMTSFIAARALCGLGAGGMMALGAIITSDLVPIEIRGQYQSYINITFGVGSALGAALGGAIADHLGWRWEFGIQVPAILLCLVGAYVTVPNRLGLLDGTKQKTLWEAMKVFDFKGSILLTTAITFLILGLVSSSILIEGPPLNKSQNLGGNVLSWSHPFVITSLVIFTICVPLFVYTESHVALPIMPLDILIHNPRAGLILSNMVGAIITSAVTFNVPLFFQAVLLESATNSGLRLMVPSIAASLVGTATGFLITWSRRLKWPLMNGGVFLLVGTVGLALMKRGLPWWIYLLFLIPSNIGQGFMFPGTFMAVLAVSPQAEMAVVTSTLILWRSLGMVMGVSASSLVMQNALVVYLNQKVVGPDKARVFSPLPISLLSSPSYIYEANIYQVIEEVRKSVQAIGELPPLYREQVIEAYALSLRDTFIMTAVLALITVLTIIPIKLPRLGQRKK